MKTIFTSLLLLTLFLHGKAQQDTITDEFSSSIIEEENSQRGTEGSFGKRLSKLSSFVSLNGYATNEFLYHEDGTSTFNNHYFNLLASAEISKHIFAEIQMEYEYGGSSLTARYAQIDYKFNDLFVIRSGKFLIPAGEYNEYLYPEYLSKTTTRAFVNKEIVPVSWGEVGVQLRGQLKINGDSSVVRPFYSFYIVNGLRGEAGGNIRTMRGNALDTLAGSLAFGGNIGAEIGNYFNIQFNFYKGDYNHAGDLDLQIYGSSLAFDNGKFSFYAAFHAAKQELSANSQKTDNEDNNKQTLDKYGFYTQVAYRYRNFEPVLRYDQIRLDGAEAGDRDRFTFALNYHFYENCVFKINYDLTKNKGIDLKDNLFSLQLSVGF